MPRDPITRMDISTDWPRSRRTRLLRSKYPDEWPTYWTAYLALLAEVWRSSDRSITLTQAWLGDLPGSIDKVGLALRSVDLLDDDERIPLEAWDEWIEPAVARWQRATRRGRSGASARWDAQASAQASAMSTAPSNALPSLPTEPTEPTEPTTARAGETADDLDETDALDAYILATGRAARDGALDWLKRLIADHGDAVVAEAIVHEWKAEPKIGTLLGRVEARAAAAVRRREKARVNGEAKRIADEERKLVEQREHMTPEQREQSELFRKALKIGTSLGGPMPIPTEADGVRTYVETWEAEHGAV